MPLVCLRFCVFASRPPELAGWHTDLPDEPLVPASWLDPLPDAELMRDTDRWAIEEQGIASLELMERAGAGLAALIAEVAPEGEISVVCGSGNNGGDGLVAARLLRDAGRSVSVWLTAAPERLSGDPRANLERLPGPAPAPFSGAALDSAAVIVDALLGTGFTGQPHGPVGEAIAAIVAGGRPVVAADVPSGVDASTGEVSGPAVHARATATFHAAKPGLWIAPGKGHVGDLRVIDIGIATGAPGGASVGLIGCGVRELIPHRDAPATKLSSGHVLVAGGCTGLTGAPCLASAAAMRAGAGYVTACVPASLNLVFESRLLEVMTRPLADRDGSLLAEGAQEVLEQARHRGGALVLGPGLGGAPGAVAFARRVARDAPVALLLDADGLNAHAGRLEALARRPAPTVMTPHAGELAKLLDIDSADVERRRLHHVREAARRSGAVVVLKGDDTLVAEPGGEVAVSPGGSPALATAGTGDVLSGVTAAMLAKGLEPFAAACAAVAVHAEAGRRAAAEHGADGVIASDVIAALPGALAGARP